ncbi:hypothetical protein ABLN97_05765 [Mycobacterium tuberculosis]
MGGVVEVSGRLDAGLLGEFGSGLPRIFVTATSQRGQFAAIALNMGCSPGACTGTLGDHALSLDSSTGSSIACPAEHRAQTSPSRRGRIDRVGV